MQRNLQREMLCFNRLTVRRTGLALARVLVMAAAIVAVAGCNRVTPPPQGDDLSIDSGANARPTYDDPFPEDLGEADVVGDSDPMAIAARDLLAPYVGRFIGDDAELRVAIDPRQPGKLLGYLNYQGQAGGVNAEVNDSGEAVGSTITASGVRTFEGQWVDDRLMVHVGDWMMVLGRAGEADASSAEWSSGSSSNAVALDAPKWSAELESPDVTAGAPADEMMAGESAIASQPLQPGDSQRPSAAIAVSSDARMAADEVDNRLAEANRVADVDPEADTSADADAKAPGPTRDTRVWADELTWVTQEHPAGFYFDMPASWQAVQSQSGLLLSPKDPASNAGAYLIFTESAGDLTTMDARTLEYLDDLVAQAAPHAQPDDRAQLAVSRLGAGRHMMWKSDSPLSPSGSPPNEPPHPQAGAWYLVSGGRLVSLMAVGSKAAMDRDAPLLQRIFMTLGVGRLQRDLRLTGRWTSASPDTFGNAAGESGESKDAWRLLPDGRVSRRQLADYFTTTPSRNIDGSLAGLAAPGGSTNGQRYGVWRTQHGWMHVYWDDGEVDQFEYTVEDGGAALLIHADNQRPNRLTLSP